MKPIYKGILALLMAMVAVFTAAADNFLLGIDGEEATSVAVYVKNLAADSVILEHNARLALTPASVMKAITTASALSVKGPDAVFETNVVLRGAKGAPGVWNGDIIVKAVADPTLESENFKSKLGFCDSIAAALRRKGISKITGTVVVRQALKDAGPIPQWEIEDVAWPYGAGLFGFNYRDNIATVYPVTGKTKPLVPGLKVSLNKVDAGNDLIRGVYSDRLMAFTRDTAKRSWALKTSVPDPAAVFIAELKNVLETKGIRIGRKTVAAPAADETPLYTHRSPAFADIMRSLMVRSDNLFAEGILRAIAPADSRKNVIKREKEIWATRGINPRYTIINDGSGLTRANRLSARFIADVLEWMARSPMADDYVSFFPRAGKDGTLRGFLAKTPLEGAVALKTGSVSAVQCYAGYKLDADGKPTHVVVVLVNGFFCPRKQVRQATEDLLLSLFDK